jgi:acetyl esterase/lipase
MIEDWDDAYANGPHIEGADEYPARWAAQAAGFREIMARRRQAECDVAYAGGERQRLDLFRPETAGNGLVVFVHGGYWRAFDKSAWSHLATGAIDRGWAVAMPSYDLAPTVSIAEITRQIGIAVSLAATMVDGPVRLAGHSAGGHLVTRMICADSPLAQDVRQRIDRVVSISGLHDLRPLLKTAMNDDFGMTEAQAEAESPALHKPIENVELVCWVGANERPEFIRQSELLANVWTGFGLETWVRRVEGQHHFNVIDGLADPQSPLSRALLE